MIYDSEYDLPLNVHSRSAGDPTISLLIQAGAKQVVMHAFDGRPAIADKGVAHGYYFSVPPSIIRSQQMDKLVQRIPLDKLLLETDAPALSPVITELNEPSNLYMSCKEIARIKQLSFEEVAKATTANAKKLFPKAFKS